MNSLVDNFGGNWQELYNTYRVYFSSEIYTNINGRPLRLAHFTRDPTMNDGPQHGISVFISDVGDGENQFLLLILHYDESKEYVADLIAHSIHIH